jgi:hypothetical protein
MAWATDVRVRFGQRRRQCLVLAWPRFNFVPGRATCCQGGFARHESKASQLRVDQAKIGGVAALRYRSLVLLLIHAPS